MQLQSTIIDIQALLQHANLKLGDTVADFGTGREAKVALPAAGVVGKNGTVYAIDVMKSILPTIDTKAKMHGLNNVQTVWSDLEVYGATKAVRDNSLVAGFLVTVLFQSQHHKEMLQECARMIRPAGRLIVADWKPGVVSPVGPTNQMRVDPAVIKKIAAELGLQLTEEFSVGPYHWGLAFVK